MENFETDFDCSGYFDEIALAISENSEKAIQISKEHSVHEIDLSCEALSSAELIANLGEAFEQNHMNEHLATIDLLGNLGYTDMLMYYCVVRDLVFIKNESDHTEAQMEIITPGQYVKEKATVKDKIFDFTITVSKNGFAKLLRILNYLKNKEFKILSNTFYMDGSDFILFLSLKAVLGYNVRINIIFNCDSKNEAIAMNGRFQELQQKIEGGDIDG